MDFFWSSGGEENDSTNKSIDQGNPKDVGDTRRQIFDGPPHITLDNFFSGDQVLQYLGERGYQATMTCRRDRLPNLGRGKLDKIFFNHVSGRTVDQRSKVARFEQPIVAVKHVPANPETGMKKYTLTHCTFQSTGGTNISGVNALLELGLYVRERNRGRGENKRRWAIEMNEARDTYLKTYSAVDKIDQTLLNYNINYRSWKWWHAPMRHAKAIAMSMAYHLYVQCCEGGVDPEWKMKPVASTRFKQELSSQMVQYKAWNKKYPGDEMMRGATQRNKNKRGGADTNEEVVSLVRCNDREIRVSYEQYEKEKKQVRNGKKPRLCSDNLELLKEHIQSMTKVHPAACAYCGKKIVMKCRICDVHLCIKEGTRLQQCHARWIFTMIGCTDWGTRIVKNSFADPKMQRDLTSQV
jgi:DNA-directed RNA polymerase subunit RPC12/RpoP